MAEFEERPREVFGHRPLGADLDLDVCEQQYRRRQDKVKDAFYQFRQHNPFLRSALVPKTLLNTIQFRNTRYH